MVDMSRMQKELTECNRDSEVSITLHDGGSTITHLAGTIVGPLDTPYEGGTFRIDIRLTVQVKASNKWELKHSGADTRNLDWVYRVSGLDFYQALLVQKESRQVSGVSLQRTGSKRHAVLTMKWPSNLDMLHAALKFISKGIRARMGITTEVKN